MHRRNARIAGSAALHRFDKAIALPFLCECSDERCDELMRISLREFDEARAGGNYLTVPGHQVDDATIVRIRESCWLYRPD